MICQECKERPATLHFTKIINGEKTEIHLCDKCAQEKGDLFMFGGVSGFSVNNLLAGLLNVSPGFQQTGEDPFPKQEVIQCDHCSMTYDQFVQIGRFGCAQCYESFKDQLDPIFRRLHSGNTSHEGKIPARVGGALHLKKRVSALRENLVQAIQEEEFERAAEIRDEIRSIERSSEQKGGDSS